MSVTIWQDSLVSALALAIRTQKADEEKRGYTADSALVAQWREALDGVKRGELLIPRIESR